MWDYPRPPAIEPTDRHIVVRFGGQVIADSRSCIRVLETSQPPAYYIPAADVRTDLLVPSGRRTFCEWKGTASYWTVVIGADRAEDAVWSYPEPTERFRSIVDHYAFYAQQMDECTVDGEVVHANAGTFYGGWITSDIVGPFKGAPGTLAW